MKMTTYPGMHLSGEVRESISLDDDDLSDVEDEVFIRDGKNGYKLAEELNVKRPLMAPRRKPKPDLTSRLKNKPPCRAFCEPCCYVFAALSILIGLITLVVVLVSIYPLPLDRLRDWLLSKSSGGDSPPIPKLLPCNNLKVMDVWSINLPSLTSESPIRLLDVNGDGYQDVLFGFGTGDTSDILPGDTLCKIFLKVPWPCDGGVLALNGVTGELIWKRWINDTVFSLECTADINGDSVDDCLAVGKHGTIIVLNSKNGSTIWQLNTGKKNVLVANFIPDQNGDNISDIISSHTSMEGVSGHLILLSGKTGEELKLIKTPTKTFYMPQLLKQNETSTLVIFGTGSPTKSGNLSIVPLENVKAGILNGTVTLYEDHNKGMLTQSVLVDITGDKIPDIITSMYNTTLVAINGNTFGQIWNFTVENAETKVVPTPGYFNSDNVTDFLVIYQKHDAILNYNYTETFIIDGKLGKPIYKPSGKSLITQLNGLLLSAEGFGYDSYVFWTYDCEKIDVEDVNCLKSPSIYRLNALNQFHEPPGFTIWTSENKSLDFSIDLPIKLLRENFNLIPKENNLNGQGEVNENYNVDQRPIDIKKYGSSFRHKDGNGLLKEFPNHLNEPTYQDPEDYSQEDMELPYNNYDDLWGQKQNNRDPRSKEKNESKKKNLSDKKYGIYDYQNIKNARTRLLHDVNNLPIDILKDTFYKNEEMKLKKSKFEQRDINSHQDKMKESEEIKKVIDKEINAQQNKTLNLWDLESEKEEQERETGYWRGKRDTDDGINFITKISSVGAILNPLNTTNTMNNTIDLVYLVYWQPQYTQEDLLNHDLQICIKDKPQELTLEDKKSLCVKEQKNLKKVYPFFQNLYKIKMGQMTVFRVRVKCECEKLDSKTERCAKFLPYEYQSWPGYLGRFGDGIFKTRN